MERQTFGALLALILVFTQPFAPIVGTSTAAPLGGDDKCKHVEGGLYVISFGHVAKECAVESQVNDAVDDVKEAQDNQTKADIYAAVVAQEASTDPFVSTISNRLEDSKTVAWTHGEVELAEAYQNGTSLAVARADAKEAQEDYYTNIQRNILAEWRAEVTAYESMNMRATTEGIKHMPVGPSDTTTLGGWPNDAKDGERMFNFADYEEKQGATYGSNVYFNGIKNKTVTLANGSTVDVPAICYTYSDDRSGGGPYKADHCYYPGNGVEMDPSGDGYGLPYHGSNVKGIYVSGNFDSSMEPMMIVDFRQYESAWDKSEQNLKEVKNETNTYAKRTYEAFQSGKIEPKDVISKVTAIQQYGTEGDSMSDVIAALSKMGISSPNLNQTGVMKVQHGGTTYTGIVMAENAPGGSWETGVTYNASNISGPVWVATTGGESVDVDGEFTISEITNKDGTTVKRVNTTTYVYKTSNTTKYADLLEQISDLRQELEEREPDGGGGTGDGGGGISLPPISTRQLIAIGAVVVGLGALSALANRD